MSAWGANAKSCKSLLDKVEQNDPRLTELFVLPTKSFGGPEVDRLAQIIEQGKNTNLKVLSASGHSIPNESLYNLGKAIAIAAAKETALSLTNTGITSLAIGDNSMGDEGILAFTKGLAEGGGKTMLEEIDLSWKGIGNSGFEMIINSLNRTLCPKLRILSLRRNDKIGESLSNSSVSEQLSFDSISHLEELDLSQCGLTSDFMTTFLACLQQQSTTTTKNTESGNNAIAPHLKKLRLQENALSGVGFQALIPLLTNSSLKELNISNCDIGNDALEALTTNNAVSDSAATNKNNLQILDLSNNGITATGAAHLAEGLKNSAPLSTLVELNLAGNELGEDGVQLLAKALATTHSVDGGANAAALAKLDLTTTKCGVQGAKDIISSGKLQSLHLFNNNLGSDGFIALAPTLKGGHASLEHLDLGGNGANQAAVVVLLSAFLEDPESVQNALKTIVVGANESGDAVEQIAEQIKQVHPLLDIARDKKASKAPDEEPTPDALVEG